MLYFTVVCCSLLCEDIIFLAVFYCQLNTLGVEYSVGNMKCYILRYDVLCSTVLCCDSSCHLPNIQILEGCFIDDIKVICCIVVFYIVVSYSVLSYSAMF